MKILNLKNNQVCLDLWITSHGQMVVDLCEFYGWTKDEVKLLVRKLIKHDFIHLDKTQMIKVNVLIDDIGNNEIRIETYHDNDEFDRTMDLKEFKKL